MTEEWTNPESGKSGNMDLMNKIIIDNATPEDASLIADAIISAIGPEITDHLAGKNNSVKDVHDIFTRLARRKDTQYSYLNSRIAKTSDATPMGVCISYDGAGIHSLRRPFFQEANETLGWNLTSEEIDGIPGETDSDEFYLDTLMTLPEFRGKGIGEALIRDARNRASALGKPLGLLCDTDNDRARRLYDRIGFTECGKRPFGGKEMYHLQLV